MVQMYGTMKSKCLDLYIDNYKHIYASMDLEFSKMKQYFSERIDNERIIITNDKINDWRNILQKLDIKKEVLFIIYPKDDQWGVRAISKYKFTNRKDLEDEDILRKEVNDDLVFAHTHKFIAVCKTKDAVIRCAKISLPKEDASKNLHRMKIS